MLRYLFSVEVGVRLSLLVLQPDVGQFGAAGLWLVMVDKLCVMSCLVGCLHYYVD